MGLGYGKPEPTEPKEAKSEEFEVRVHVKPYEHPLPNVPQSGGEEDQRVRTEEGSTWTFRNNTWFLRH